MRTTIEIDDDVLQAAKELARFENTTAGRIISRFARLGLNGAKQTSSDEFIYKNGIPVFPSRGEIITMEHIQQIMDEERI